MRKIISKNIKIIKRSNLLNKKNYPKLLGKGAFGQVYLLQNPVRVVKIIDKKYSYLKSEKLDETRNKQKKMQELYILEEVANMCRLKKYVIIVLCVF